jgi:eukaryotic-like serine/threonine-protein kinase
MGTVWQAEHAQSGEAFALKFLKGASSPAGVRRFLREARAAAAVRHPSVVEVREIVETDDGAPVLVLELLSGEPLSQTLARTEQLPPREVARVLCPVVNAVGTAHALGVVHRDLKPQNIYLAGDAVKVLDFGLAKLSADIGTKTQSDRSATGSLLGTPCYMSPEQVLGARDVDHRADIWSLGIILYQCLSGILPTEADSVVQVLKGILTRSIWPLEQAAPGVPIDLARLVDRMLVRDRDQRLSSLRDVEAVLAQLAGQTAVGFGPPRVDLASHEPGRRAEAARSRDPMRLLLGRPTPFVGREAELTALELLLERSFSESAALAAVVTAPAGVGKSRLRHELLRRLDDRGEPVAVWMARGDPVGAGGAFALASQMVRSAAHIVDGEPLEERRRKLLARAARTVPEAHVEEVANFLGELVGAPSPDDGDPKLRAARADAVLMGDRIRDAWCRFAEAETSANPLLLVLEDLQWGDLGTIGMCDALLRLFPDRRLAVIAFARPEVHERFPDLFRRRAVQHITLPLLSRKASEKLATSVLEGASPERIRHVVGRAGGNAFFLEELIRLSAQGKDGSLPETVFAMIEARLLSLDPAAQRLLRAASVFGLAFWDEGVAAVTGEPSISRRLDELVEQELVTRRATSRFSEGREYAFRHGLFRESAYAMLGDEERAVAHRSAGAWLEEVGEGDAEALAEHFEKGGNAERAAQTLLRAAEHAFEAGDVDAAITRVERALRTGVSGELKGELARLRGEAIFWLGDNAAAAESAGEALEHLGEGTEAWCDARGLFAVASMKLGRLADLQTSGEALVRSAAAVPVGPAWLRAAGRTAVNLFIGGQVELGERLLAVADGLPESADPTARARIQCARATRAGVGGDMARYLELTAVATSTFAAAGDTRSRVNQQTNLGYGHLELGLFEEAQALLGDVIAEADRMGLYSVAEVARQNMAWALARTGALDEACRRQRACVQAFEAMGDRRMAGGSRVYLAAVLCALGRFEDADEEVRRALPCLEATPSLRLYALAVHADVLSKAGHTERALDAAREGMSILDVGTVEGGDALLRLVHAKLLAATGDRAGARSALASARDRLLARAARIANASWRAAFLENVPENAETLRLASAWIDGALVTEPEGAPRTTT